MSDEKAALENFKAPTSIKLSLLWASLMFLYIYNDYFSLYVPGTIAHMEAGRIGPLGPATESVLVGVAIMLALPSLMIVLSATLWPQVSRWLNIVLGVAYTGIEALTMIGSPLFYKIVVGFEIVLTLLIVWYALRWPRLCENPIGAGAVSPNSCNWAGKLPLSRISRFLTSPSLWKTENCANETSVFTQPRPVSAVAARAVRHRRIAGSTPIRSQDSQIRQQAGFSGPGCRT